MDEIKKIKARIDAARLPLGVQDKVNELVAEMELNPTNIHQLSRYIDIFLQLPWTASSKDILDLNYAKEKLDEFHYGLEEIKERVLEYISVLGLQKERGSVSLSRAPIFLFSGLVGTGKTTMAQSIAASLNRQFVRIPFGGLGDPYYLRGRSRFSPEADPGAIIKSLITAKTNNPVILLDEIDRIADEAFNTIMGTLVELLDPEQNNRFVDHYLDYPFDLSQVIFCATCNNTNRLATAVLDRLEPIQMPSYNDQEKTVIGQQYILPKVLSDSGLTQNDLIIEESVWPSIIRPLGFDAGVRTLKRNLETIARKASLLIFSKKVNGKIIIDNNNIKQFLSG